MHLIFSLILCLCSMCVCVCVCAFFFCFSSRHFIRRYRLLLIEKYRLNVRSSLICKLTSQTTNSSFDFVFICKFFAAQMNLYLLLLLLLQYVFFFFFCCFSSDSRVYFIVVIFLHTLSLCLLHSFRICWLTVNYSACFCSIFFILLLLATYSFLFLFLFSFSFVLCEKLFHLHGKKMSVLISLLADINDF